MNRDELIGWRKEEGSLDPWTGIGSMFEPDGPTLAAIAFQAGLAVLALRRRAQHRGRPAPPRAPRWSATIVGGTE